MKLKTYCNLQISFSNTFLTQRDIVTNCSRMEQYVEGLEKTMYENLMLVYNAGIPIAVSTDAGNPGTLHGISIFDEMEAMQNAGVPARDILVMATKNGASTMGRLDDFGTLEKGKMADLIILEKDPSKEMEHEVYYPCNERRPVARCQTTIYQYAYS